MSGEIFKPDVATYFVARNTDGSILHEGITQPVQVTTTGQDNLLPFENENDFLGEITNYPNNFPDLPVAGVQLFTGELYRWNNIVVQVRQDHIRTEHDPPDVLALFITWRENGDALEWVEAEQVYVGTRRTHLLILYECIQAHVTQSDWTPPVVPALWQPVIEPTDEWAPGVSYSIGDEATYLDILYRCIQAHVSQLGWEPPIVPALWALV